MSGVQAGDSFTTDVVGQVRQLPVPQGLEVLWGKDFQGVKREAPEDVAVVLEVQASQQAAQIAAQLLNVLPGEVGYDAF